MKDSLLRSSLTERFGSFAPELLADTPLPETAAVMLRHRTHLKFKDKPVSEALLAVTAQEAG